MQHASLLRSMPYTSDCTTLTVTRARCTFTSRTKKAPTMYYRQKCSVRLLYVRRYWSCVGPCCIPPRRLVASPCQRATHSTSSRVCLTCLAGGRLAWPGTPCALCASDTHTWVGLPMRVLYITPCNSMRAQRTVQVLVAGSLLRVVWCRS